MMVRSGITMSVRQQPHRAQVVQENNPKNRKPVDPPPIVELKYANDHDDPTHGQWLVSPRTFMMVTLIDTNDEPVPGKFLIGQTVSSLHRLKDINSKDGGFFVFGDISARKMGTFKLRFSLFDTSKETEEVVYMGHVDSDAFPVMAQRDFGSMSESTVLTRTFSDQGVKLRVRKDNRAISSIGTKRPYNASPVASSSPVHHPSLYGGAVQDQQYGGTTPDVKRQRSDSDYGHQSLYSGMSLGETSLSQYTNTIPSSTRHWGTEDHHSRSHGNYSQHSPLNLPVMGRVQSMNMSTSTGWQNMHQQSALPSPSPSVSTQTPSYPSVSSQQQTSSIFGDPGSNSSIPRNYYATGYPYTSQSQYQTQHSGDAQSAYSDLQLPVTSLHDGAGLDSAQSSSYTHGYMQAGGMFGTEANEASGAFAFMGDTKSSNTHF